MKKSLYLSFFLCFPFILSAQWFEQSSNTTSHLRSIDFVNHNTGWVAGSYGRILGTTDGGHIWEETGQHHATASSVTFFSICFPTELSGYACGNLKPDEYYMRNWASTTDGGQSWSWPTSWTFPAGTWYSVFFINDLTGWQVGSQGRIAKTTSGVEGFNTVANLSEVLFSVYFINSDIGWVAGKNGYIAKSTEGGSDWAEIDPGISYDLKSIFFWDELLGWAVGYDNDVGQIIKTTDGGESWNSVSFPPSLVLHGVQFVTDSIGWACGSYNKNSEETGMILYSNDGGDSWEIQYDCDTISVLSDLFFIDKHSGWACGSNGRILHTTNAGGTTIGATNQLINGIYILDNNYPNPFKDKTVFRFTIPKNLNVEIDLIDIKGNVLLKVLNEKRPAGTHEVIFNRSSLDDGLYYYRLTAGNFSQIKKMIVVH